jgi:DNA ligase-1
MGQGAGWFGVDEMGAAGAGLGANMMLAQTYREAVDPTGMWVSEKLDGCRAFWDGEVLRTKDSWLPIDAPEFITQALPAGEALDGELWAGRGTFQLMRVLVQYKRASDPAWERVRYMVFDAPTTEEVPVELRWEHARQCRGPHVEFVEQWRCDGRTALHKDFARVVRGGGEGLMLRTPRHFYEFGRSRHWLKLKPCGVD